jgi:hypothetical protein
MFAYREVLRQPDNLKCLCKYTSRSTFFLEIFHTVTEEPLYVSSFFYLCTAILLSLKLYTLFTGLVTASSLLVSRLLAYCCFVHESTCGSAFQHFRVSFDAIVSFSLFSVCNLQVRMFSYFLWHGPRMFLVPSLLGLQFHNRWRYICCLLGRWFLLFLWFVGCWFCLFGSGLRFGDKRHNIYPGKPSRGRKPSKKFLIINSLYNVQEITQTNT